ncbi:MAG: hypothetical protein FI707_02925 [SAR202 cluster bacterium]|nr:hypothetical protein [SAR202 cluster bacterium]MDP6665719.1 hypothetical protein [SAR202 cluster bacterium]MDP6798356.1 hypothetical protein [SAR202 cluster bacterium]MQG67726.1 hypothetical protein [SAR202 cluster bacterium]HAL47692.1 hypothetical protein [Dehalococcoidia bacterium]
MPKTIRAPSVESTVGPVAAPFGEKGSVVLFVLYHGSYQKIRRLLTEQPAQVKDHENRGYFEFLGTSD